MSLMVQGLRLHIPNERAQSSVPSQGPRSHRLWLKIPYYATKEIEDPHMKKIKSSEAKYINTYLKSK